MEDSLRASVRGLELVDQARKRKGWNRQSAAWAQAALTSVASLKQFWRRERISRETFTRICQAVGLSDWQEIAADCQPVQQTAIDWGEAPEPAFFYGRDRELETLDQWIVGDRCKLVALLGMGGMGKTTLAVRMMQLVGNGEGGGQKAEGEEDAGTRGCGDAERKAEGRRQEAEGEEDTEISAIQNSKFKIQNSPPTPFAHVVWRSLRNAPPIEDLLADLMRFFAGPQPQIESPVGTQGCAPLLSQLIAHLREHRCLVVLDNVESILVSNDSLAVGSYRSGYGDYGELLRRVGEERHQSCLVLTSREQPREIALLEGEKVRSLRLQGLAQAEGQKILEKVGAFFTSAAAGGVIVDHYAGNPLALKLAAAGIRDLLHGNVGEFVTLLQQGTLLFSDIRDLLERHFNRLSNFEQEVMYWLAIAREPVSLEDLKTDLLAPESRLKLTETLDSLQRRSLLEIIPAGFTLQPAVMEYVTSRLLEGVLGEIVQSCGEDGGDAETRRRGDAEMEQKAEGRGQRAEENAGTQRNGDGKNSIQNSKLKTQNFSPTPHSRLPTPHLKNHALIKATAKDYIREAQTHLILEPLIERLRAAFDTTEDIKTALTRLISTLQGKPAIKTGYIGGNILNLLCHLQVDLTGFDFSDLTLWQADLRRTILHRVDFTRSDLSRSAFTETFSNVLSIAFSPDSKTLAKSDEQGWISVWQIETGKQLLSFKAHSNWVFSVAFSPDGTTLASGGLDRTVKLWNLNTGECLQTFQMHDGGISAIAYATGAVDSPDQQRNGNLLASGSADQTIKLVDLQTGACQMTLTGHQGIVRAIALSPDGHTLASASLDHTIKLWDINTGECLKTLEDTTAIYAVAFVEMGEDTGERGRGDAGTRGRGEYNPQFKIQNLELSSPLTPSPPHLLVSAGDDGTVKLWDVTTGECVQILEGHSDRVWSLAASRTGEILVSGSDDKTIKIWDLDTGKCLKTLQGHQNRIWSVALSPDGRTLASGSNDRTLRLWNTSNGQCLRVLQGYDNGTSPIAFLEQKAEGRGQEAEGEDTEIFSIQNSKFKIQNLESTQNSKLKTPLTPHSSLLTLFTFSADQIVRLWDLQTKQCLKAIPLPTKAAMQAVLSPDGKTLASGSLDHTIRLCDVESGVCLKTLQGHTAWVRTVAFSPNGTLLASASGDQTIRFWDVETGQCVQTLSGHTNPIQSIAFSPDGSVLASGSWDWTTKLWDVHSGSCLHTLKEHTDQLREIRFSPDGQILVSSSLDQTLRLWEVATGTCFKILDDHQAEVEAIACSPDGRLLASASQDNTVRFWQLPSGECLQVLPVQTGYSGALVFSADSQTLAIGGDGGTCTLWDVRSIECLHTLQVPRPYESLNITHIKGLTDAQKASLCALGAFVE